jgi:hypothetical protein
MRFRELHQTLQANRWHTQAYSLYPIGDSPASSPWRLPAQTSLSDYIAALFQPLCLELPGLVPLLTQYGSDMACLLAGNEWYLIYVLSSSPTDTKCYLIGGTPSGSTSLSEAVHKAGWRLPDELTSLFNVHNGFGALSPLGLFWSYDAVVPSHRLALLSPGLESHDPPHNLNDLLLFYPDGAGNAQCFYRPYLGTDTPTVDWDHETREIGRREGFWNFVDRSLVSFIVQRLNGNWQKVPLPQERKARGE